MDSKNGGLPMYDSTIVSSELKAVAIEIPGVFIKVLRRDPRLGLVVLSRMAPGATIPEHWHSDAHETAFVLQGDFIEAGVSYGPGTFFYGKAGCPHGPHTSRTGCTVLTHYSSTADLDFNAVD